jgi:hypothetical protein
MKSKVLLLIVAVAALVVGFFVGRWHTGTSWNRFVEYYMHQREANAVQSYVRALTYFRDGKQDDALMVLETHLNSALITFVTYDSVPPAQREELVSRAVGVAREYRSQHPWKSSSAEVDEGIRRVLERVR